MVKWQHRYSLLLLATLTKLHMQKTNREYNGQINLAESNILGPSATTYLIMPEWN